MLIKRQHFLVAIVLLTITALTACQSQPTQQPVTQSAQQPTSQPVASSTQPPTQQPTASISLTATLKELTGKVSIKQPGSSDYFPASAGMELQVSGSVQTGNDGHARLDLSTGTIIRMSPSSTFTLTSNQPSNGSLATELKLIAGEIFVILKGGNASVTTPSGVASVRGSYLSVYIDPSTQTVTVTCLEGNCSAGNSAGNTDFGTGQEVTLFTCTAGQCTVPRVGPMTPQQFQEWLNNNPDLQQIPGLFATMTAVASNQSSGAAQGGTGSCLNIIGPSGGSSFDPMGRVTFSWDGRSDAARYRLSIHYPNGATMSFYTDSTSIARYLESMPGGGSYTWDVTALDSAGNSICTTGESSFTKQRYDTPVPHHPGEPPEEAPSENPDPGPYTCPPMC